MFNHIRSWLLTARHRPRTTVRRPRHFGAAMEGLESRCVLSALALTGGESTELPAFETILVDRLENITAGAPSGIQVGENRVNFSTELGSIHVDLSAVIRSRFSFELNQGEIVLTLPDNSTRPVGSLPVLSDPPLNRFPDPSDAGGLIDIGGFDEPSPSETYSEGTEFDSRDAHDVLSKLRYLPDTSRTSDTQPTMPQAGRVDLSSEFGEVEMAAPGQAGMASSEFEGGMVALVRSPVAEKSAVMDAAAGADIDSLLNVNVEMDSAAGKFRAFEVSTAEEPTAPASPPDATGFRTSGFSNGKDLSLVTAATDSALADLVLAEILAEEIAAGDQAEAAGESGLKADVPPSALADPRNEKRSSICLGLAGAMLAVSARYASLPQQDERQNLTPRLRRTGG